MQNAALTAYRANDPYEQLIAQILQVESEPRYDIQTKQRTLERQQSILNDLDSAVSSLHSLMSSFTDTISNPLEGRAASLSSEDDYAVSAGDNSATGSHTMQVLRLASTDTRASKQYTAVGSDLRSFFDTNGSQTFDINVAHPIEGDESNRVAVSVTIDPAGTTDEEILQEISSAINEAMSAAATAETIDGDEKVSANMVNETSDTARFTIRAGETGFANRLTFTDSANGLLSLLEVSAGTTASGTSGGQITAVGTSEADSLLNSKFVLDGLTLYRSSNQVDDALTGATLDIKKVMTDATEFSIGPDTDGIVTQISDFISKYNEVNSLILGNTMVDANLDIRGAFAGDSTLRNLRFNMRNDVASTVTSQVSGAVNLLSQMGFAIGQDGTLSIEDEDDLRSAIDANPAAIQSLFNGSDGIATRLESRLDAYLGADGIFDNRVDIIDESVLRMKKQIISFDERMGRREASLRQQFARMQEAIALFQGQSQFFGGLGGFGG